jgi:hypothetical protein
VSLAPCLQGRCGEKSGLRPRREASHRLVCRGSEVGGVVFVEARERLLRVVFLAEAEAQGEVRLRRGLWFLC